jgi:superfamily II DNA or RNA helicase
MTTTFKIRKAPQAEPPRLLPVGTNVKDYRVLRDGQRRGLEVLGDHRCTFLESPCGSGKTAITLTLLKRREAAYPLRIVVVPTVAIAKQWVMKAQTVYGEINVRAEYGFFTDAQLIDL